MKIYNYGSFITIWIGKPSNWKWRIYISLPKISIHKIKTINGCVFYDK